MPVALLALLPTLVNLAEKLIPKSSDGTPTGDRKKRLVTDLLLCNIQVLADHDVIPDWAAGEAADAAISEAIEYAVVALGKKPA